jgi:hypothetical protein
MLTWRRRERIAAFRWRRSTAIWTSSKTFADLNRRRKPGGAEEKAERLVQQELSRRRWTEEGEGSGAESEARLVKGAHRVASASGDDDDSGMACATLADGQRGSLKNTLRLANSRDP